MDNHLVAGRIEVNGIEGRVVDTNYRSSRIKDRNGDLIVIPNNVLAGATLVNYDASCTPV